MQSVAAADLKAQAGEGKEVILLDIMASKQGQG